MAEFAVVIPTYRRPHLLAATVESVLRQTYPASEIVVVRDGPDAAVPESLRTGSVRVIDRPKEGVAAARNAGTAATHAAWLCFLDDDDLWHPDRLLVTAEYLDSHTDCAAVQADWWSFAERSLSGIDLVASDLDQCLAASAHLSASSDGDYLNITGRSFDLLLGQNRENILTASIRRDVLVKAGGFPASYTCAEDWVMAINVARYTEWHYINQRLAFRREHAGNNTKVNPTNDLVTIRALRQVWRDTSRPVPPHRPMEEYALDYRHLVQTSFWHAMRRCRMRIASEILREGVGLLPRRRDRLVVGVPPSVNRQFARIRSSARGPRLSPPEAASKVRDDESTNNGPASG